MSRYPAECHLACTVAVGRCNKSSVTLQLHQLVLLAPGARNEGSRLCVGSSEVLVMCTALYVESNCMEFYAPEEALSCFLQKLLGFKWINVLGETSLNNCPKDDLKVYSGFSKC